ncbi:OmpA family protein [candidate division FCPU426 bacterium]|nr:OmpA family protein [candidate division FCPU426 bacterium]
MLKKRLSYVAIILALAVGGCATSNAVKGGAIGAVGGGAVGALIGHYAGNTALGAIIGAAVGGTAGALIGANMDRQAAEMRKDLQNAKVERVGEGIKITFDSGILFQKNSALLNTTSQTNIASLSKILNKYPDTNIVVEGHTDSTGTEAHNQELSERRAKSVANQCMSNGVKNDRFNIMGYGEGQPVADNETEMGRQQNRRVEIAIFANEKMKKAAKNGTLN